mmetsp:Transcript_3301/g.4579  ORF Transcript_3301/g.4579 Transcript_3301/m.4579 type:complete len:201 (-) Transcript_3301:30-632(-)
MRNHDQYLKYLVKFHTLNLMISFLCLYLYIILARLLVLILQFYVNIVDSIVLALHELKNLPLLMLRAHLLSHEFLMVKLYHLNIVDVVFLHLYIAHALYFALILLFLFHYAQLHKPLPSRTSHLLKLYTSILVTHYFLHFLLVISEQTRFFSTHIAFSLSHIHFDHYTFSSIHSFRIFYLNLLEMHVYFDTQDLTIAPML